MSSAAHLVLIFFWSGTAGIHVYHNPVLGDDNFPDPCVLRAPDGMFYAYATGNAPIISNIQVATSPDLVHWNRLGGALSNITNTAWGNGLQFWAPDVTQQRWQGRDLYVMYYAGQSKETTRQRMCIGAAISDIPQGPFEDVGRPLICRAGYVAIDPKRVDTDDESYLFWGSGQNGSIFVTPLMRDHWDFLKGGTSKVVLPSSWASEYEKTVEGVWVTYDNNAQGSAVWWMYYSGSNCCGNNAHYAVSVAASNSLMGPYKKKAMLLNTSNSAILSETTGLFQAPGHNSLIKDDSGATWMLYHAWQGNERTKRVLMLDRVVYRDGFPWVGLPSSAPVSAPIIHTSPKLDLVV